MTPTKPGETPDAPVGETNAAGQDTTGSETVNHLESSVRLRAEDSIDGLMGSEPVREPPSPVPAAPSPTEEVEKLKDFLNSIVDETDLEQFIHLSNYAVDLARRLEAALDSYRVEETEHAETEKELHAAVKRAEELQRRLDSKGTYTCPICGEDYPHNHPEREGEVTRQDCLHIEQLLRRLYTTNDQIPEDLARRTANLLAKLLDRAEAAEQQVREQRWIPVAERLPHQQQMVLIHSPYSQRGAVQYGFYGFKSSGEKRDWFVHVAGGWESAELTGDPVTHWMPLPTAPGSDGKEER